MEKNVYEKDQTQNSEMEARADVLGLKHIGKLDFLKGEEIAAWKRRFVVNNVGHIKAFVGSAVATTQHCWEPWIPYTSRSYVALESQYCLPMGEKIKTEAYGKNNKMNWFHKRPHCS